jgi:hypothetical protein
VAWAGAGAETGEAGSTDGNGLENIDTSLTAPAASINKPAIRSSVGTDRERDGWRLRVRKEGGGDVDCVATLCGMGGWDRIQDGRSADGPMRQHTAMHCSIART